MASEIFAFEKLQIIVGKADEVENRLALAPVQTGGVYIPVHQTMVVHVRHGARYLSEDKEETWRGEICLAELLPQANMLWAVCLEHDCVPLVHVGIALAEVEQMRMRR